MKASTYFYMFFLCIKVVLIMGHYIKLLTIFIWKFAIFWSWQLILWTLGQLAPASFFLLATDSRPPCVRYLCCWLIDWGSTFGTTKCRTFDISEFRNFEYESHESWIIRFFHFWIYFLLLRFFSILRTLKIHIW